MSLVLATAGPPSIEYASSNLGGTQILPNRSQQITKYSTDPLLSSVQATLKRECGFCLITSGEAFKA